MNFWSVHVLLRTARVGEVGTALAANAALRAAKSELGSECGVWDKNFSGPQRGFGGRRVNRVHLQPLDRKMRPDDGQRLHMAVVASLRRAGFDVASEPAVRD